MSGELVWEEDTPYNLLVNINATVADIAASAIGGALDGRSSAMSDVSGLISANRSHEVILERIGTKAEDNESTIFDLLRSLRNGALGTKRGTDYRSLWNISTTVEASLGTPTNIENRSLWEVIMAVEASLGSYSSSSTLSSDLSTVLGRLGESSGELATVSLFDLLQNSEIGLGANMGKLHLAIEGNSNISNALADNEHGLPFIKSILGNEEYGLEALQEALSTVGGRLNSTMSGFPRILSILTDDFSGLSAIQSTLDGTNGIKADITTFQSTLGTFSNNAKSVSSILVDLQNTVGLKAENETSIVRRVKSIQSFLETSVRTNLTLILRQVKELNRNSTIDILERISRESESVTINRTLETAQILNEIDIVKTDVEDIESYLGLPSFEADRPGTVLGWFDEIDAALSDGENGLAQIMKAATLANNRLGDTTGGLVKILQILGTNSEEMTIFEVLAKNLANTTFELSQLDTNLNIKASKILTNCTAEASQVEAHIDAKSSEVMSNCTAEASRVEAFINTKSSDIMKNCTGEASQVEDFINTKSSDIMNNCTGEASQLEALIDMKAGDILSHATSETSRIEEFINMKSAEIMNNSTSELFAIESFLEGLINTNKAVLDSTSNGLPRIVSLLTEENSNGLPSYIKAALDDTSRGLSGILGRLSNSSSALSVLQSTVGDKAGGKSVLSLLNDDDFGLQSIKDYLMLTIKTELDAMLRQLNGLNTNNTIDILDKIVEKSDGVTANRTVETQMVIQKIGEVNEEILEVELKLLDSTSGLPGCISNVTSARTSIENLLQNSVFGLEHIKNAINIANARLGDDDVNINGFPKQMLDLLQNSEFGLQALMDILVGSGSDSIVSLLSSTDTSLETRIGDAKTALHADITSTKNAIKIEIGDAKAELQSGINTTRGELEGAKTMIQSDIATTRSDLQSDIATTQNKLDEAKSALETEIGGAKTALQSEITTTQNRLEEAKSALEADIGEAKTALDTKIDATQNKLEEAKSALEADIGGAKTALQSEITTTQNRLEEAKSALEADIGEARTALDTKIDATQNKLEEAKSALEADIGGAKTALDTKIDAARNELEGLIENLENQLQPASGSSSSTRLLQARASSSVEGSLGSAFGSSFGLGVDVRCPPTRGPRKSTKAQKKSRTMNIDLLVNTQTYGENCDASITEVVAVYVDRTGAYKSQAGTITRSVDMSTGLQIVSFELSKSSNGIYS